MINFMELIVFDLDGTLLSARSQLSPYTLDTLNALRERGIAYTVATGRTLHAAQDLLEGAGFSHPHIYKNGVVIFNPHQQCYSHQYLMKNSEIERVIEALLSQHIAPFVFTLDADENHSVYHAPLVTEAEKKLAKMISAERGLPVLPLSALPRQCSITNISALGAPAGIVAVSDMIANEPDLVAYSGHALEGGGLYWLDVHHANGSKGAAVSTLRDELGFERIICFGDSDNDLSMFACADESYAPENAKTAVKAAATAVIEHHDADGVARFLRERFSL